MDSQRRPLGTVNTTSGDRGYGPNSGFTLAQTVDVLQSMVSTSLDSGDTNQLCDDLTRLCGVFGCAEPFYKSVMVSFGMPNEACLKCKTWEDVFQGVCVEDKKLRERDGWMRNGLLRRLKYFETFQLHTAARRLKEAACPTLAWLVERRGGNAEEARDPLTKYTILEAVRSVRWSDAPYLHDQYGPIAEWDVADVDDMNYLFAEAANFDGDLSRWDVSNVTDMYGMFQDARRFNGDLSRWDVSNVNNMGHMFYYATSFNGDLSRWDVSTVNNMGHMFYYATSFNSDLSRWDVSDVKEMYGMFVFATNFNSDLSRWDVSTVKDMGAMFWAATSFNSDLSRWDVSSVNYMNGMFYRATSFNSDLSRWDVSIVDDVYGMFDEAEAYRPSHVIGSQATIPAPRVHGEPKDLFNRKLFPPLPEKLPELPGLPGLPELPELPDLT